MTFYETKVMKKEPDWLKKKLKTDHSASAAIDKKDSVFVETMQFFRRLHSPEE